MIGLPLYLTQRISALIMVPLVLGHLGLMIYATKGGLSAEEILSRTQGSWFWGSYYGLFVVAAALHAAIGLRVIVHETLQIGEQALNLITLFFVAGFLSLGARAVMAVIL